jgi:hypothetical protein
MAAWTRLVGQVLVGLGLVAAVGGCQPRHGYYQDTYEEERVITPSGVGDSLAVYRTSSAAPETVIERTTATTTSRNGPGVAVVARGRASPLRVDVVTPPTALICEDIPVRFRVTNTSGLDSPDAFVEATLPPGLRTPSGDTRVRMNVGLVPAGASREVTVPVRAERTGSFLSMASVSPDPDVKSEVVETAMVVGKPVLNLTLEATEPSAEANVVVVNLRVSNTGNVTAQDTTVNATLSPNARAIDRGTAVENMDQLTWNFGLLAPGEAKEAVVRLDAFQPGAVTGNATATARCAETAQASFTKGVR